MNGSPRARAWLAGVLAPLVCCASSTRPAADVALEELAQSGGWQRAEIRGMSVYSKCERRAHAARAREALPFRGLDRALGGTSFRLDRPVKVFLFARMSQWERLADPGYLGSATTSRWWEASR
jgi:hypothetical protein